MTTFRILGIHHFNNEAQPDFVFSMSQIEGCYMTTKRKIIAILASALLCLVVLFPPRMIGTTMISSVSRGFLLGDVYHANVPSGYQSNGKGHHVMFYTTVSCRIDVTRLVMELIVVLSAATTFALCLNLRSGKPSENSDGSE
ncbi:MAG: hypothetical protein QM501_03090 [Gimesia sp.]